MDVRVHAAPSPMPAPNPARPFRAPDLPVRAKTTPIKPPNTKPAVVWIIIFSRPVFMVKETAVSEEGGGMVLFCEDSLIVMNGICIYGYCIREIKDETR
jgi:hypothetical protein